MKRISALITMLVLFFASLVIVAPAANAVDKRTCVSRAEFRAVHRPQTQTQVRNIFDRPGYEIQRFEEYIDDGYWDSYYVEDGNWEYFDYDGDGITDETVWVPLGYWVDYWVDTSYTMIDTFRTYPKCHDKNFDRGRGRVAINFDNYTSVYSGMRLYSKWRNNPWVGWARSVVAGKPHPDAKTAKNTPAPHRNTKRVVIKP